MRKSVFSGSSAAFLPHKTLVCPECGGALAHDKHPADSVRGFRYRTRRCPVCAAEWGTKQPPETITGKVGAVAPSPQP